MKATLPIQFLALPAAITLMAACSTRATPIKDDSAGGAIGESRSHAHSALCRQEADTDDAKPAPLLRTVLKP